MDTRRGFFRKIGAAVAGAAGAGLGIKALEAKQPSGMSVWHLPKDSKYEYGFTGFKKADDQTFRGGTLRLADLEEMYNDAYYGGRARPGQIYTTKEGRKEWNRLLERHYGRNS